MRTRDLEHQEQSLLFQWAAHAERRHPELALLFAIPNFAGRLGQATARHGARLKAEGRKAGVPDVCLPVARGGFHALYVEMKSPTGTLRPAQRAWIDALLGAGNCVCVARSWEDARDQILEYLTSVP